MAGSGVFLDTNILVCAVRPESPRYFHARGLLRRLEEADSEIWISRQILREFLTVLSRPQPPLPPMTRNALLSAAQEYERAFCFAEDQDVVTQQLFLLLDQLPTGGKQVHDANIVATMLAYGIPRLVTYNLEDFRRFSGLVDVSDDVST